MKRKELKFIEENLEDAKTRMSGSYLEWRKLEDCCSTRDPPCTQAGGGAVPRVPRGAQDDKQVTPWGPHGTQAWGGAVPRAPMGGQGEGSRKEQRQNPFRKGGQEDQVSWAEEVEQQLAPVGRD